MYFHYKNTYVCFERLRDYKKIGSHNSNIRRQYMQKFIRTPKYIKFSRLLASSAGSSITPINYFGFSSIADSTSKIPFKLKVKLKSETPSLLTPESSPIKLPDQSDDANFTMEDLGTYK